MFQMRRLWFDQCCANSTLMSNLNTEETNRYQLDNTGELWLVERELHFKMQSWITY
jgi:hypothetical protein